MGHMAAARGFDGDYSQMGRDLVVGPDGRLTDPSSLRKLSMRPEAGADTELCAEHSGQGNFSLSFAHRSSNHNNQPMAERRAKAASPGTLFRHDHRAPTTPKLAAQDSTQGEPRGKADEEDPGSNAPMSEGLLTREVNQQM